MHRPIRVTRTKGYHLTGLKNHQPITNLAGNGDLVDQVNFDVRDGTTKVDTKARAAAVGAKVAADPTFDQTMTQRLFTPDGTGVSPIDQLLKQQNPGATPEQLATESARLKASPQEAEQLYAQSTGDQALLEAGSHDAWTHGVDTQVQDGRGLENSAISEVANAFIPGSSAVMGAIRSGADAYGGVALKPSDPRDTALTGDQLRVRDQNRVGSEADLQSQISMAQDAANRGEPGAAEKLQHLNQQLPAAMATAPGADITQRHLDQANAVGEEGQFGDTVQNAITSVIPGALPMAGLLGAKKQLLDAPAQATPGADLGQQADLNHAHAANSVEKAVESGEGYLGMRALGNKFTQNAAAFTSKDPNTIGGRFERAWKPLSSPTATPEQLAAAKATQAARAATGVEGAAADAAKAPGFVARAAAGVGQLAKSQDLQPLVQAGKNVWQAGQNVWQNPITQRLLQPAVDFSKPLGALPGAVSRAAAPVGEAASAIGKAAPWLANGGRVLGRLGAIGAVANAGVRVGQGIRFAYGDQGQQEYADGVQAQTEADATRTPWQKTKDIGGAVGNLALGDPWHASHLIAEGMAGGDYRDAIRGNAMGSSIAAKELPGHMKALQSYFPNVSTDQLTMVARHAAQQSDNNYQLFHGNDDKPYPAGISSFEKRLNDPQGPYAQLPANIKGVYRDLGRRLGGTTAEGLISDPTWQAQLDPKAQPQQYSTPHISYAPQPDKPPAAPQAAPAPAAPTPPPAYAQHPGQAAQSPRAPAYAQHPAKAPAIKIPPPPEPSAGMAPIGQPFSPMRATKSAMAKRAAAVMPPTTVMPPAAPTQPQTPPAPQQQPAAPKQAAPPQAPPAPQSTIPKTAPSHPFGAARPAIQPQQPQDPQQAAPVSPAGESSVPPPPGAMQPGQPAAGQPAAAAAAPAQPYDWKQLTAPVPAGQDASAAYTRRIQDGMTADAGLTDAQKVQQMQSREAVLGSPIARAMVAHQMNDPSLADPALKYQDYEKKLLDDGSKGYSDKLQANLAKLPPQSAGDFMKNNWSLAMIPLGLMMALSGGSNMTKILGVLATVGGGMGLYSRYQALKTPEFQAYLQKSVAGKTTPQEDAQFKQPMQDLALASKSGAVDLPAMVKQHVDAMWQSAQPKVAPPEQAPSMVSQGLATGYNWLNKLKSLIPATPPAAPVPAPQPAPVTK